MSHRSPESPPSHPGSQHPSGQPLAQFWEPIQAAPAPVVGIICQPDQWPWNVTLDRARPLPAALEWRLDSIFGQDIRQPLPDPSGFSHPPLPLLLTARHPEEGGEHRLTEDERSRLLLHFLPMADAVDVECRSWDSMGPVAQAARDQGAAVIVSVHDFETTPDRSRLEDLLKHAADTGADAVKIATRTDQPDQLLRLLDLLPRAGSDSLRLVVMGMGRLGKASRLAAVACGSPLAYGHLGAANTRGQWHAVELAEALIRQQDDGFDDA